MSYLTESEIDGMQDECEDTMLDTCKVGTRTSGDFGDPSRTVSFSYGSSIPCGVSKDSGGESDNGSQIDLSSVRVRLPMGTAIVAGDRLSITHRRGEELATPEIYALNGAPRGGTICLIVSASRVLGNKDA